MRAVQQPAPAKINLYLHIGKKTAEGLHLLESLIVFLELADRVTLSKKNKDDPVLTISGPFAKQIEKEPWQDNLAVKALRAVFPDWQQWHIDLFKQIPACAGLGGGSADAAALLRAHAQFMKKENLEDYRDICSLLGSDVTACLYAQPTIIKGIGHNLSPFFDLPAFGIVIAWPEEGASTKEIYQNFRPSSSFSPMTFYSSLDSDMVRSGNINFWIDHLKSCRNDLEESAIQLYAPIEDLLNLMREIKDFYLVRMSGSGSACFGLCASGKEKSLAKLLRQACDRKDLKKEVSIFASRPLASFQLKE